MANKNSNSNNTIWRWCFYGAWLVVSLLQAYYTGLLADEAYYWKYAQDLSWGYFDHPPVVAALIKPGYWLLQNELGVRLLFILFSIGFLYLLELLVQPKKLLLYYLSVGSIGAFHFLGFLALPDMPLLFFSAAFLYLYKQYAAADGWLISILLAATTTLLLLSKYHGILLVGFTVLSNPALLKRKTFWPIALLSMNLFIPHIQWQVANDFPSVKYHLYERSAEGYKIEFTLNYVTSVLLMFSPIAGIVFAWHSFKTKTRDSFDRTLKWFLAGTLLFFLVMTYKGRAEANWVACALIPAIILGYKQCENKTWFPKFTSFSSGITLVLTLCLRAYLVYDFLPDTKQFFYIKETLHHTKKWAGEIQSLAGERPVVFMNKYQYAAWYEFYTGRTAISLNNRMGRKNQYNIWDDEYNIQGKEIMLMMNYHTDGMDSVTTEKGVFQYRFIDNFRSGSAIKITTGITQVNVTPTELIEIPFRISLTGKNKWDVEANPNYPAVIHSMLFEKGKLIGDESKEFYIKNKMLTDPGEEHHVTVQAPAKKGTYTLYLDVAMGGLPACISSEKITVHVQ